MRLLILGLCIFMLIGCSTPSEQALTWTRQEDHYRLNHINHVVTDHYKVMSYHNGDWQCLLCGKAYDKRGKEYK